jgi:hypothetical protein
MFDDSEGIATAAAWFFLAQPGMACTIVRLPFPGVLE